MCTAAEHIFNRVTRMGSHIFNFLGVRLFFLFTVYQTHKYVCTANENEK